MKNLRMMPVSPLMEMQSPIDFGDRPRPPMKENALTGWRVEIGVLRKTEKRCVKAALWSGSNANETNAGIRSRVQIVGNSGRLVLTESSLSEYPHCSSSDLIGE